MRDDGGTAFPRLQPHNPQFDYADPGMTLRDWFAGQALALLDSDAVRNFAEHYETTAPKAAAEQAYRIADALIAERSK